MPNPCFEPLLAFMMQHHACSAAFKAVKSAQNWDELCSHALAGEWSAWVVCECEALASAKDAYLKALESAGRAYQEALLSAGRAYQEALLSAGRAYQEALLSAGRTYQEALLSAGRTYQEAIESASRAYHGVVVPVGRAYREAIALIQQPLIPIVRNYFEPKS